MKILFSQIKELVPGLKAGPKEVGDVLTFNGFMMDSLKEVSFEGKKDYLIGLEVRQNRVDCLSAMGIAKEVAAYYRLKTVFKKPVFKFSSRTIPRIKVDAKKGVKKAFAIEISGLKNESSPAWLKNYLNLFDINSVNLLVDISNYVMLLTGFPSHLIDKEKVKRSFVWSINEGFKGITTLDGSEIPLKGGELIIRDEEKLLGLAGVVGGKGGAIESNTTEIIAEMAVYERAMIRKDSRSLRITTEASTRLEKDLDPNGLDYAFKVLVSMILEYGKGSVSSALFSYHPQKLNRKAIKFDPQLSARFAGINIPSLESERILKSLGFSIKKSGTNLLVTPPENRMDINLKEDLVEEVIRIYGYKKIPIEETPLLRVVEDITPLRLKLMEKVRDILSIIGFDEVLSWPLTKKEINDLTNFRDWENIRTENSVNEEFPDLRQSMASSLLSQWEQFQKNGLERIRFFEIGKIFGKGETYEERDSLGIFLSDENPVAVSKMRRVLETILRSLGTSVSYQDFKNPPSLAAENSAWSINSDLGIVYKAKLEGNIAIAEIDLAKLEKEITRSNPNPTKEITKKLVSLDANVELLKSASIYDFLGKLEKKNVFAIEVVDSFNLAEKIRYTIHVTYQELSDEEAKEIHLKAFNLKQ